MEISEMTKIIRPRTNRMIDSATEIDSLCTELKRLGITFFGHTRIFNDNSRIDLNNHAEMIEEFYYGKDKAYEFYTPDFKPYDMLDGVQLLDTFEDNTSLRFLREGYNIDHMLVKIEKHESYYDIWNFGTKRENKKITHLYLNNLEIFILFTVFYKDKCKELIQVCSKDPIIVEEMPPNVGNKNIEDKQLTEKIFSSLKSKTNRYYVNGVFGDDHLTMSEMECCFWIQQGKTSEEMAIILNCSKRTIQKHIENIKNKLHCHNIGQLINLMALP